MVLKRLVWIWLILLILVNVIPIGNDTSRSLSGNRLLDFRLDYLAHALMLLFFGWIWLYGKIKGIKFFHAHERLKYSLIVLSAGIFLELFQALIPWRSFNPVDMFYNGIGAVLAVLVVTLF